MSSSILKEEEGRNGMNSDIKKQSSFLVPVHSGYISRLLAVLRDSTSAEYGLCVLHQLYVEYIATQSSSSAATLFWTYIKRDFVKLQYVSSYIQYASMTLLFMMNTGSIYYILLKGVTKGYSWQQQFLRLYAVSFLSDMFFVHAVEVVWIEWLLPSMIYQEVRNVIMEVYDIVDKFPENWNQFSISNAVSSGESISILLATRKPALVESKIAMLIHSELEKKKQQHYVDKKAMIAKDVVFLVWCAYFPLEVHSIFAAIVASLIWTFILYLWYTFSIVVIVMIVLFFVGVTTWWFVENRKSPVMSQPTGMQHVPVPIASSSMLAPIPIVAPTVIPVPPSVENKKEDMVNDNLVTKFEEPLKEVDAEVNVARGDKVNILNRDTKSESDDSHSNISDFSYDLSDETFSDV